MQPQTDYNVQSLPGWQSHAGGDIGGVSPKIYTMTQLKNSAVFHIAGTTVPGKCADAEWYLSRPIAPGAKSLCMSYGIILSESSLTDCQADEMDIKLTDEDGDTYNGSSQLDYSKNGQLQVGIGGGGWINTGYTLGKYAPNIVHWVQNFYTFDFAKKTLSFLDIVIDDVLYPINQNVPAVEANWKNFNQAMVQVQADLTELGLQYSKTVSHLNLTWS